MVVMDASGSIGEWHFERGRRALKTMMELEADSKNDTKYAAVTFSNNASVNFPFLPCTESANKILEIPYEKDGLTNTQAGLARAKKLFDESSEGKYPYRK